MKLRHDEVKTKTRSTWIQWKFLFYKAKTIRWKPSKRPPLTSSITTRTKSDPERTKGVHPPFWFGLKYRGWRAMIISPPTTSDKTHLIPENQSGFSAGLYVIIKIHPWRNPTLIWEARGKMMNQWGWNKERNSFWSWDGKMKSGGQMRAGGTGKGSRWKRRSKRRQMTED